jgi:hypothetical protein
MNPESLESSFGQWRTAHQSATTAETGLLHASLLAMQGHRPPPTEDQWLAAKRLRAVARELFQHAMHDVGRVNAAAARTVAQPGPHSPEFGGAPPGRDRSQR